MSDQPTSPEPPELGTPVLDWSELPSRFSYLIEPARRYGGPSLREYVQRVECRKTLTDDEVHALSDLAIRMGRDQKAITDWLATHREGAESWHLNWLIVFASEMFPEAFDKPDSPTPPEFPLAYRLAGPPVTLHHQGRVRAVLPSNGSNSILAGGGAFDGPGELKLWTPGNAWSAVETAGRWGCVLRLAQSGDGRFVAVADDYGVSILITPALRVIHAHAFDRPSFRFVSCAIFVKDQLVFADSLGSIWSWRFLDGQDPCEAVTSDATQISDIAVGIRDRYVAVSSEYFSFHILDAASLEVRGSFDAHDGQIDCLAFTSDTLFTAGDCTIKLWWQSSFYLITSLSQPQNVSAMAVSDEKKLLAVGGPGAIYLWSLRTFRMIDTLIGHAGWVNALAFDSATGALISGGDDGTVRIWQLEPQ